MNKERIYSTHSRGKVYHIPGCRYANWIPEKYVARQTKYRVESEGYRPCRCCNTLKFRVEREFHDLNLYCKDKQIEFHLKPDALFVKTEIGCWKIVYRNDLQNYALYHRNDTGYPADFDHPEWETYHKQYDKPLVSSLTDAFTYIYKHDLFRKAEREANAKIKEAKPDQKLKKKERMIERRKKMRRVEYLFRKIEDGDREFIKLSIC
ncbi:MAG: hypothetical protein LIO96_15125 [Lachnospiraceae bacterium]|nr:hypothetical protein [Lachnospiraceae bacterium]